MGTVCGMQKYGVLASDSTQDSLDQRLIGAKAEIKYLVNVMVQTEKFTAEYMAESAKFSRGKLN